MTHPDDLPPDGPAVMPATDEAALADLGEPSLDHPVHVVMMFHNGAQDPVHWNNLLHNLTTPESWDDWGDFSNVAEFLSGYAVATGVRYALGDDFEPVDDVAYVKLIPDSVFGAETVIVNQELLVADAQIVTLVRRPDLPGGGWRIHRIGIEALPEELPRASR
jgi:hypothetical protein